MTSPREQRYQVQEPVQAGAPGVVGGGAASGLAHLPVGAVPAGTPMTTTAVQTSSTERSTPLHEGREGLPAHLRTDATQEAANELRRTTDNTAGYDAGTTSRGGGSGGTTEAMTGGLAAGGALGDDRRKGLGDLAHGQL